MFWDKLKGNRLGFFDLFNRHAAAAKEGTLVLLKLSESFPDIKEHAARIEEIEHECDSVTHMTMDLLHRSFITPLDRDEIQKLISKMDDIMDYVDRTAKTLSIFDFPCLPAQLKKMIEILSWSQAKVEEAVKLIPAFKYEEELLNILKDIHTLENEADRANHIGTMELFRDNADQPLMVIKMRLIYKSVEQAIDACEDIADIIEGIVLEHF